MGKKSLQSTITLYGNVDGSFSKLANTVAKFGNQVSAVGTTMSWLSVPLIAAGKQVTQLYTDYDNAKLWVQSLQDYSDKTMEKIEGVARQYGKTTRFTAAQTMEAIGEITQAGLGYSDMVDVLPNVLNMAVAGNIELADSASLLISNMYATGTSFKDSTAYLDMLTTAANESNTDIDSLAQAVQRMGGTSRYFAGGNREMLTWLGTMGNLGYQAGEAGTYLRNTMLALAAPTDKAAEVMEALDASEEELAAAVDDADTQKSIATMKKYGVEMYDTTGNMRPLVDVLNDLNAATSTLTEQQKNQALSDIFPKRTLSAASGMMSEIEYATQLWEKLGDATGATSQMATTRDSGIYGTLKQLESVWEDIEISAGKMLGGDLITFANQATDFLTDVSNSDPAVFRQWVSGLETLAIAGPALLIGGKLISGLGSLIAAAGTPGGAFAIGAAGLFALYKTSTDYAKFLKEKNIEEHFGDLEVDAQGLALRVDQLAEGFDANTATLYRYGDALDAATESYQNYGNELSARLIDASAFGYTLNDADKTNLINLASDMYTQVTAGIEAARSENGSFLDLIFKDNDPTGESLSTRFDTYFSGLYAEAGNVRDKMMSALSFALKDGEITPDEEKDIQTYIDKWHKIMAEINAGIEMDAFYSDLAKGQRLGYAGLQETNTALSDARASREAELMAEADRAAGRAKRSGASQAEIDAIYSNAQTYADNQLMPMVEAQTKLNVEAIGAAYGDVFSKNRRVSGAGYNDILQLVDTGLSSNKLLGNGSTKDNPEYASTSLGANYYARQYGFDIDSTQVAAVKDSYAQLQMAYAPEKLTQDISALMETGKAIPDYMAETYRMYADMARVFASTGDIGLSMKLMNDKGNLLWDVLNGGTQSVFGNGNDTTLGANVDKTQLQNSAMEAGNLGLSALYSSWGDPVLNAWVQVSGIEGTGTASTGTSKKSGKSTGFQQFAEGGRATSASIFGEGETAEWAIPEEHTSRTAALLASAANASGFTFDELIRRTGGLNGKPANVQAAPVFAPVITIQGANKSMEGITEELFQKFVDWTEANKLEQERMAYS